MLAVGGVPWLVGSIGRLSMGGRKEMDLGVFGIVDVGLFGDMVVDGRFGRVGHNLLTFPYQG